MTLEHETSPDPDLSKNQSWLGHGHWGCWGKQKLRFSLCFELRAWDTHGDTESWTRFTWRNCTIPYNSSMFLIFQNGFPWPHFHTGLQDRMLPIVSVPNYWRFCIPTYSDFLLRITLTMGIRKESPTEAMSPGAPIMKHEVRKLLWSRALWTPWERWAWLPIPSGWARWPVFAAIFAFAGRSGSSFRFCKTNSHDKSTETLDDIDGIARLWSHFISFHMLSYRYRSHPVSNMPRCPVLQTVRPAAGPRPKRKGDVVVKLRISNSVGA